MIGIKKVIFKLVKPVIKLCSNRDSWEENIFRAKRLIFGDAYIIRDARMKCIDKDVIENNIAALNDSYSGVDVTQVEPMLIVSLTTYPARIGDIRYTLYSLLRQTVKPNKIIVWLAEDEFPDNTEQLSTEFGQYGVSVRFCSNLRSYKKLIPALKNFPNSVIVTADDDIYYEENWLECLYIAYKEQPHYIHCHRADLIEFDADGQYLPYRKWKTAISCDAVVPSFFNFFIGCGGVLYPPGSLFRDVQKEDIFMQLAPTADDIWFWAMAVKQGTKINVVKDNISEMTYIDPAKELGIGGAPLWRLNVGRRMNDKQLEAVSSQYNLRNILQQCLR